MRSWRNRLAAVLLAVGAAAAGAQATPPTWVYVLRESGEIAVVNTTRRAVEKIVRLSHPSPDRMYPTPGGKFVLVTYRETADVSAIDVELGAETRSFVLSTGRAESLTYSPMGDTVLTTQTGSGRIDIWAHSRSVLEHKQTLTAGLAGNPALFNRRATRLYRSSATGLDFVYLKTGEVISQVAHAGGGMTWAFTPDFRNLWGAGLDGDTVVVVDEARSRLVEALTVPHRPQEPVFSEDGTRVYLIGATGRSVTILDTRTRKVAGTIDLPSAVTQIAMGQGDELWAGDPAGAVYIADTRKTAAPVRLAIGAATRQMSLIAVRRGEGYACF